MVTIPVNPVSPQDLIEWDTVKKELNRIKAAEMLLRKKIFGGMFPQALDGEGTFYQPLENGFRLKAIAKLDRSVDIAHFNAMREQFAALQINADSLIKYTPELVIRTYRELTDEQRTLVDCALTIKPGAPSLEIVAPKDNG